LRAALSRRPGQTKFIPVGTLSEALKAATILKQALPVEDILTRKIYRRLE